MQTANMMAHAKSTSIPVTVYVKEANYNLDIFWSSSIFLFNYTFCKLQCDWQLYVPCDIANAGV